MACLGLPLRLDRGVPRLRFPSGQRRSRGLPRRLERRPGDEDRNRLTVGLRFIWIIPAYIVVYLVGIAAGVVLLLAWFIVLFTGKWPEGMRQFCVGYFRWNSRVLAYGVLLTDEYPPFRLDPCVTGCELALEVAEPRDDALRRARPPRPPGPGRAASPRPG